MSKPPGAVQNSISSVSSQGSQKGSRPVCKEQSRAKKGRDAETESGTKKKGRRDQVSHDAQVRHSQGSQKGVARCSASRLSYCYCLTGRGGRRNFKGRFSESPNSHPEGKVFSRPSNLGEKEAKLRRGSSDLRITREKESQGGFKRIKNNCTSKKRHARSAPNQEFFVDTWS